MPSHLLAMLVVRELVASQQAGRVGKETRSHGVALTGNGVRSRTRSADVPGHQSQIDDGLSRPDTLVTLIDTHRPPERNTSAQMDPLGESLDASRRDTGTGSYLFQ